MKDMFMNTGNSGDVAGNPGDSEGGPGENTGNSGVRLENPGDVAASRAGEESVDDTENSLSDKAYWSSDTGTLDYDARRALLQLIRGPSINAERNRELWKALMGNQEALRSRLADMFLELVIDTDSEIAFVRNASAEDVKIPKAVKSVSLTLIDTVMVLTLRKELLLDSFNRVFVSKDELFEQMGNYRPVSKLDEAAFRKRLESSWSKLVRAGILQPAETEDRCEVSQVLKLIYGVDEVKALNEEFDRLLNEYKEATSGEATNEAAAQEEATSGETVHEATANEAAAYKEAAYGESSDDLGRSLSDGSDDRDADDEHEHDLDPDDEEE